MKAFLTTTFVTLGVIFIIVILFCIYFVVADPLHVKPLFFGAGPKKTLSTQTVGEGATSTSSETQTGTIPFLSDTQKKALEAFGIDPASLPSSITSEQEACFEGKLGAARVAEIKAGDSPTALEFFSAKACL